MAMTEQDHAIVEKITRVLPKKTKLLASAQTLVMIFDQSASKGEEDTPKPQSA